MTIIPQGYKETEIGVLPNDWDIKSYGELFYFLNTATYSRAELSDDSDIDYVHYGDIHTKCNYHVDFTKMILPCITSDKLKKYPLLEIGDLIMADASEDYEGIGKSVEILNIGKKSISGLHTFLLRNKSNSLALGFKGYIHANQYVRNQFNSLATGMKVYGVSKGNLRSILIPIPPLPEQTAIANALRDIDDLINTTQALIAKKKAIKTATMQQLLTPKEDWVEMKLGDVRLQIVLGTIQSKL
ncbi:MAG: restriction endonuclease subunit S [Saprospiraceae bacterium]|nr:restriction endonuclease subunit S [Saprospiraceae bacterium]